MQFIKHDLGQLSGGEIAEITITSAANVRLLDSHNFLMYRSGQRHKYNGGHYKSSPVRFDIPPRRALVCCCRPWRLCWRSRFVDSRSVGGSCFRLARGYGGAGGRLIRRCPRRYGATEWGRLYVFCQEIKLAPRAARYVTRWQLT